MIGTFNISVVIAAYNREKTLRRCIDSILNQTFKPKEIIVVDDCSTDNTVKIIEEYSEEIVKLVSLNKKSGAQVARNMGIKTAKHEWIAFQDSDDEWLPNKLEMQINVIKESKCNVVHCDCFVQKNGERWVFGVPKYEGNIYKSLLKAPGPVFPGLLVKKTSLIEMNFLDEKVPSYQEWDTVIRLAQNNEFGFVKEALFIYHLHDGETISKSKEKDAMGWEYVINKFEKEILKQCGPLTLIKHFESLIEKFSILNDAKKVIEYQEKIKSLRSKLTLIQLVFTTYNNSKKRLKGFIKKLIKG